MTAGAIAGFVGLVPSSTSTGVTSLAQQTRWAGAWTTAAQRATGAAGLSLDPTYFEPNWSEKGFADQTVRQVVRVTAGGTQVRIQLSNQYGGRPLHIASATIARSSAGAAVQSQSMRVLRFDGARTVTIPRGGRASSDAVPLRVRAGEHLTVSMYLSGPTGPATFHYYALATSYRSSGDHASDRQATAFTARSHSWYYLVGVDVRGAGVMSQTVVAFGDSITDGAFSTVDLDNRYPDVLADLLGRGRHAVAVVNEGIFGNRLLNDSRCFGNSALSRFHRDVLDRPEVGTLIVLEGINDIWMSDANGFSCLEPNPTVSAEQMIAAYRALIDGAHRRGIRVIGATLLPYGGFASYSHRGEAVRQVLNSWIRDTHTFDAVIDFDAVVRDPAHPDRMLPTFDSGDHLHPNDRGYEVMAEAAFSVLSRGPQR
ncbi:SGNH/GDSL hydrolase family protein [Kribbella pittospori]|uniref:SGNH/GDSL hydrolase family protein n=2 Tax=Kribbella pittospori TaxID=722689 RepID=A0A4R0KA74_9ACTN|nr:SGNH/GDSL hydrolase family protein [Kribbella pittospori]